MPTLWRIAKESNAGMKTHRPLSFLLDENVPRQVLFALQTAGYAAITVQDAGLRSQPDTAVFTYLRRQQMTLITRDTDFLNRIRFPPPHGGILILRFFRGTSVADIALIVVRAINQLASDDPSNRVFRIDIHGVQEEK